MYRQLKYYGYAISFLLLSYQNVFCQGISFSHISVNDGLLTNFVNCICQDKKGFLWVGTQNGLQRYDGNIFKSVKSRDTGKRIPNKPVDQLI